MGEKVTKKKEKKRKKKTVVNEQSKLEKGNKKNHSFETYRKSGRMQEVVFDLYCVLMKFTKSANTHKKHSLDDETRPFPFYLKIVRFFPIRN